MRKTKTMGVRKNLKSECRRGGKKERGGNSGNVRGGKKIERLGGKWREKRGRSPGWTSHRLESWSSLY